MLKPPYDRYETLYLYAFSGTHPALRNLSDPDFIGCWEEEDLTVLFFHREKPALPERIKREFGLDFELSARVPYTEWGEGRDLEPFTIGPFTFAPVWQGSPGALIYDPGVVFGSGLRARSSRPISGLSFPWREGWCWPTFTRGSWWSFWDCPLSSKRSIISSLVSPPPWKGNFGPCWPEDL